MIKIIVIFFVYHITQKLYGRKLQQMKHSKLMWINRRRSIKRVGRKNLDELLHIHSSKFTFPPCTIWYTHAVNDKLVIALHIHIYQIVLFQIFNFQWFVCTAAMTSCMSFRRYATINCKHTTSYISVPFSIIHNWLLYTLH